MSGIGGFQTRLNGTENFNAAANTSATATSSLTSYIGEVVSISLPEIGLTDIDVSSMDSTENYMEAVGGSKDPGLIDVTLNYDDTETASLFAAVGDANEIWQISFPDNSIWKCSGYINKILGGEATANDKLTGVVSIKLSGKPTQSTSFTAPAAPA